MSQIYKPGTKLSSTVCKTQIMVLRAPAEELTITCGGAPMQVGDPEELGSLDSAQANGTLVGKRYTDEAESMEFLCTRGGEGSVSVAGYSIDIKAAKKLPSSD
ncbi:MAG: hypothetical protein HKO02_16385 [Hyphomonadaceae bacterium]|nr:hypothetical protein [Hyphomonadaceae bacterium]